MPQADQGNPASGQPASGQKDNFRDELRSIGRQAAPGTLLAGHISLLGLDRIKEKLGSNWDRLAARVDRIAQTTIKRYLVPGDIFTQWKGSSYVLVFSTLGPEQARMKCRLISNEISKALLGEENAENIEVKTVVVKLDHTFHIEDLGSLDKILTQANEPQEPQTIETEQKHAAPVQQPPQRRFAFRPMWNPRKRVLSSYRCVVTGTSKVLAADPKEVEELDFAAAEHVLDELDAILADRRVLLLGLPVHFETLSVGVTQRRYMELLAKRLTPDRARYALIALLDPPDGVVQSRLSQLLSPLRRYCRGIVATVNIDTPELGIFAAAGVHAVGFDVAAKSLPELTVMHHMNRFARAGERHNFGAFACGLRTTSLVAAGVGAGFTSLDGDAVAKVVDRPERVLSFQLSDLYQQFTR